MKIQCNVCDIAEAKVLCCADEAALCWACDENVHSANFLASKHQRVPLSDSSSPMPKCDICQENMGYFFCLEDRALLCRKCDVAIHTLNNSMSIHQRFLLTGVKAGVVEVGTSNPPSIPRTSSREGAPQAPVANRRPTQTSSSIPVDAGGGGSAPRTFPSGGGSQASQWPMDEYLGLGEFNPNYGLMDYNGSPKANIGKGSDSESSSIIRSSSEERLDEEVSFGQVRDASWMVVPQMPSPPTASGLNWPKMHHELAEAAAFVPNTGCLPLRRTSRNQSGSRRWRRFL